MTYYIASENSGDGFGSQFLSRIAGIIYANYHNLNYVHVPIRSLVLDDKPFVSRDNEIKDANILLENIMKNFEIKFIDELSSSDVVNTYSRVDIYNQLNLNPNLYYTDDVLNKFKASYSINPPDYYVPNKLNVSIHIRRGNDISSDNFNRYVSSDIYDNIIEKILDRYDESIINIFSWNDPCLKVKSDRIKYHTVSDGGEEFLSHFNGLVHSDILLVGASTFSLCAGFFNKNIVLCNKNIHRMIVNPYVPSWEDNYQKIIEKV